MRPNRPAAIVPLVLTLVVAGATGGVASTADDELPVLALPTTASGADLALTTDDALRPPPAAFDVDAAGEAALDVVDRFDTTSWDVETLAADIGPDPRAAFELVRDRIGFDPYPGVLRGAHGTLVARAGGAWDRALLLLAILEAGGHTARLVTGELDPEAADRILARAADRPRPALDSPDPAGVIALDRAALETRARRDHAAVTIALADAMPAAADEQARLHEAVRTHAWVQLADATGGWLDLDASLADAEPGDVLAGLAEPVESVPDGMRHRVELRVIAETLAEGVSTERTVLDVPLDAATATDAEIWLTFQAAAGGLAGLTLQEAISGGTWAPVLTVDGDDIAGEEIEIGGGGDAGDFFFGGGAELIGLRIELASIAPGREPLLAERVLLDRVSPADRAAGTFVPELLAPLPPAGEPLPALAGIHQVLVSTGGADLRSHAVGRAIALGLGADLVNEEAAADGLALHDLLYPLGVSNGALVVASERVIVDGLGGDEGVRAFVARPRAFLVSFVPLPDVPDGSGLIIDLALDDVDVVPADEPAMAGAMRLWYGMLQSALETEMTLDRSRAVDPATARVQSVSLSMPDELAVVGPDALEGVDPARTALRSALAAGRTAIVVGPPTATAAFWAIEPATGRTSAIVEPGLRIGSIGGGNYVNSSAGGPRYVIDPRTGNTMGTIRDGRFTPTRRPPPSRCSGGTEYVLVLGCVSLPASMTAGMATNVVVTAAVAWAIATLELIFLT